MTENEFLLQDRIAKIKSINEKYDLEHNGMFRTVVVKIQPY